MSVSMDQKTWVRTFSLFTWQTRLILEGRKDDVCPFLYQATLDLVHAGMDLGFTKPSMDEVQPWLNFYDAGGEANPNARIHIGTNN